eukprot:GHRQ01032692.1.p1 GENE.GHRQ01032692.1~~GHRQ01032692.1.p1  ORF type:complete len:180 (-),score=22.80 GHRQ01032692.1:290-829(-)
MPCQRVCHTACACTVQQDSCARSWLCKQAVRLYKTGSGIVTISLQAFWTISTAIRCRPQQAESSHVRFCCCCPRRRFLVFLTLTMVGFALAFYSLYRQDREQFVDFANVWHSMASMYSFMLAMFDYRVSWGHARHRLSNCLDVVTSEGVARRPCAISDGMHHAGCTRRWQRTVLLCCPV